jgi:hypothetical protein
VANDLSPSAVKLIQANIAHNGLDAGDGGGKVRVTQGDAWWVSAPAVAMYLLSSSTVLSGTILNSLSKKKKKKTLLLFFGGGSANCDISYIICLVLWWWW